MIGDGVSAKVGKDRAPRAVQDDATIDVRVAGKGHLAAQQLLAKDAIAHGWLQVVIAGQGAIVPGKDHSGQEDGAIGRDADIGRVGGRDGDTVAQLVGVGITIAPKSIDFVFIKPFSKSKFNNYPAIQSTEGMV